MLKKIIVGLFPLGLAAMDQAATSVIRGTQQEDVLIIKDKNGRNYTLSKAALPLSRFIQGAYNFNKQHGKAERPIVLDLAQANLNPAQLGDIIATLNMLVVLEQDEKVRSSLNYIMERLTLEQLIEEVYIAYYLEAHKIAELLAPYIAQKIIARTVPASEVARQLRNMPFSVREGVAQEYREHLKRISPWATQRILTGHTGEVTSVAYSLDGKHIVTASLDGTARIWDAQTGAVAHILVGHTDSVSSAAYSPDGKQIVTGSIDETAKIWDAQTGALVRTLTERANGVLYSAVYSPDGKQLVTASRNGTVRIWDAQTGALVHTFTGHTNWFFASGILSAIYSRDGKYIVTASEDRTARIWDARTGTLIHILTAHEGRVNSAAYSPDGKHIVTSSADNTARIWYQPAIDAFIAELNKPDVGAVRRDIRSAQQKAAQRKERRAAVRHDTT